MWNATRSAMLLLVALLFTGCANEMSSLLYNGIGSEMHTSQTLDRAVSADKYFQIICRRSGTESRSGGGSCDSLTLSQEEWRRLVYTALNDIDERCDLYVEALDNARKDRRLVIQQVKLIRDTTTAIVALAKPSSVLAITVLNEVFSLTESTAENYFSRMLLTLENGTVYGVVKKQQLAYRESLKFGGSGQTAGQGYIYKVDSKPTAYFAIRGYLRLCLPSTIESEVNAAITDVHYTDPNGRVTGQRQIIRSTNPDLLALSAVPKTPRDANEPVDRWNRGGNGNGGRGGNGGTSPYDPPSRPRAENAIPGTDEESLSKLDAQDLQARLCVEPTGDLGVLQPISATRRALREYESRLNGVTVDGIFNKGVIDQLKLTKRCSELDQRNAGPKTPFEKFEYYTRDGDPNPVLTNLQRDLNLIVFRASKNEALRQDREVLVQLFPVGRLPDPALDPASFAPTNSFDAQTRARIAHVYDIASTYSQLKEKLTSAAAPRDRMSTELAEALQSVKTRFCRQKYGTCP